MDYVLFGMGYGASLMLLGWALRTFGPQLKYKDPPTEDNTEYLVEQRFWVRFIQGLGGVIAIAGTAMVLLTFVVVLVNPSDSSGSNISLAIWVFILVAVLVWCWFYLSNYGLAGVWSRESGYGLRGSRTSSLSGRTARVVSTNEAEPKKRLSRPVSEPVSTTPEVEPNSIELIEEPVEESSITMEQHEEVESEVAEVEPVIEPVYDFGDSAETTVPSDSHGRAEALRRLRERQARARQI